MAAGFAIGRRLFVFPPDPAIFMTIMPQAPSRYLLIAMLLLLLVNYPLLSAANKPVFIGGFPLLYLYIGAIWVLAIILLYLTTRYYQKQGHE